jgi:hypothetical protein
MQMCSPKLSKMIALMSTKRGMRKDSPAEGACPIYGTWPILNFVGYHSQTSLAPYDCTGSAILVVIITEFN